jgi:hypothetical protein
MDLCCCTNGLEKRVQRFSTGAGPSTEIIKIAVEFAGAASRRSGRSGKRMAASAKETVIIVHGTWATPDPGESRWYQPFDGLDAAKSFTVQLDAALQERGSPARCWAHCTPGNQIFHWSGDNSWLARTRAASELGENVTKLRNQGWHVHIIAHSHGGNIVIEALPQIMAAPKSIGSPIKIVTLGTPFMDTRSQLLERAKRATAMFRGLLWLTVIVSIVIAGILSLLALLSFQPDEVFFILIFVPLFFAGLVFAFQWRFLFARTPRFRDESASGIQPQFLALGSLMDETWQILHHARSINNPLAVRLSLRSYLFSSLRSRMSRDADIDRIFGATKPFKSLGVATRWLNTLAYVFIILILLIGMPAIIMNFGWLLGVSFYAVLFTFWCFGVLFHRSFPSGPFYTDAASGPYRWFLRLIRALANIPSEVLTYVIRREAWPVLVAMAMGLEGYPFELPSVERHPGSIIVTYEDIPKGTVQRALDKRSAWIADHLGDFSQTFSKLTITAADITSLLRAIEDDQTLVHGAYYTDDECIARIADWIADRG